MTTTEPRVRRAAADEAAAIAALAARTFPLSLIHI